MLRQYHVRRWIYLAIACCMLSACGCAASLPNARALFRNIRRKESRTVPAQSRQAKSCQLSARTQTAIASLRRHGYLTRVMARHLALIRAIAGTRLVGGNKVILLQNGPAIYAAMHHAIAGAKHSINLETFTFADDAVGRKFASWLINRSRRGVQVNLIYDSFGSLNTPASFFERLRRNGVSVVAFNPIMDPAPQPGHSVIHRDHRKLLVVDGRIAITGSVNIADEYDRHAHHGPQEAAAVSQMPWRDTDVEIEGPAVAQCQRLFVDAWFRQTGGLLPTADYFPHLKARGKQLVQVIGSTPEAGFSAIYFVLLSAIHSARKNVYIADAYFAPGRQFLRRLKAASRRGVDVELLLPHRTDHPIVLYAGRWYYGGLLRAHVRIYERLNAFLHAKTATVDGVWSTVGSSNLDWWSAARDDEINVVVLGHSFAEQMEAAFRKDRSRSLTITRTAWRYRSPLERFDEFSGWLVQRWL